MVFGRTAARSEAFGPLDAAGGAPVLVGSAAGSCAEDVAVRARGELIERVCNILSGRRAERAARVVATYEDLLRRGIPALDPASWRELEAMHDPATADGEEAGAGHVGTELRAAPMLWVPGLSLVAGSEVLVPAGAVFLQYRPPAGCAQLLRAGSTGLSAHPSGAHATRHALLELFERDLVWRSWYLPARDPAEPAMEQVRAGPEELGATISSALGALQLEAAVLALSGPAGVTCVVACLHEPDRTGQSFGARCVLLQAPSAPHSGGACQRLDGPVRKAVYEALMVRWSMGTSVARQAWAAMRKRHGAAGPPEPVTALEHALLTFHRQDSLRHWLAGVTAGGPAAGSGLGPEQEPTEPASAGADEGRLARLLAGHTGEDVVAVETTVAAMAPGGEVVVRVVAPGARRLQADDRRDVLAGGGPEGTGRAGRGLGTLPHPFG